MKKNELFEHLDTSFINYTDELKQNHKNHKKRIQKAFKWWEEHGGLKENLTIGKIKINGIKCICICCDFRGVPLFNCELSIAPDSFTHDIGNGCGGIITVKF